MPLFTEERLISRVQDQLRKGGRVSDSLESKAKNILSESLNEQRMFSAKDYDIFLSHSSNDATIVAGLKLELEDLGYSVYIDWIEDPQLNRSNVTRETALILQKRMKQCKSLIYAFSRNASNSKWMPWELGYFDGIKGTAAVLPISKESYKEEFKGTEYLGIYFYIQVARGNETGKQMLWVYETQSKYVSFNSWLKGNQPVQHK